MWCRAHPHNDYVSELQVHSGRAGSGGITVKRERRERAEMEMSIRKRSARSSRYTVKLQQNESRPTIYGILVLNSCHELSTPTFFYYCLLCVFLYVCTSNFSHLDHTIADEGS